MGRKTTLAPKAAARINRALAASRGSERNTRIIYNALQDEEKDQIGSSQFERLVRRRLEPGMECFEAHEFASEEGGAPVRIFLPK